jgi:hypothetical protein
MLRAVCWVKQPHQEHRSYCLYSLAWSRIVSLQHRTYIQFFPRKSGGMGQRLPAIFSLLADVYTPEVVAQIGLAARCASARIGSPIGKEKQSGFRDQEKAPLVRGAYRSEARVCRRTAFGFTERIQTSVKKRLFKIAHPSADSSPHHRRAAINFPPWCAEATGPHIRFHVDVSVK